MRLSAPAGNDQLTEHTFAAFEVVCAEQHLARVTLYPCFGT